MINDKNKQLPSGKIEEILDSLDSTPRAVVPDFFYTRVKAKMVARFETRDKVAVPIIKRPWMLRPAFALTALAAVLLVNIAVIFQKNDTLESTISELDTLQSIAAEYSLNDNNAILFDINQDK